jgi:hypothetical protein
MEEKKKKKYNPYWKKNKNKPKKSPTGESAEVKEPIEAENKETEARPEKKSFKKVKKKRYSAREKAAFWFGAGVSAQKNQNTGWLLRNGSAKILDSYWIGHYRERVNGVSDFLWDKSRRRKRR